MTNPNRRPWTIEAIRISTTDGQIMLPGWSNGVFGLDWRGGYDDVFGYQVTHLASGWGAVGVLANLEQLQAWVDRVSDLDDWSGSTRDQLSEMLDRVRPVLRAMFVEINGFDPSTLIAPAGFHMSEGMTVKGAA